MTKKSENLSRSGIKNYLNPLEVFCDTNDLMLNWKKINRLFPKQGKKSGGLPYTTKQVAKTISNESQLRNKVLIHCLAAGGMRVGAFPELKLKDIVDYKDGCKMIRVYADSTYEYTTFWTPEASSIFDDYLTIRKNDNEYLNSNSPAFRTTYRLGSQKARPMTLSAIQGIIRRALEKAGLRSPEDKINGRFQTMMDHGFRKRWNTIVKNTDGMKIITAEKMMGHSIQTIPLDETYNIPDAEKLFIEFKKAIPELTIDDSQRLKFKNEKLEKEKSELEITRAEIEEMEKKMKDLQEKSTEAQKMMATMMLTMNEHKKEFLPKEIFDRDLPIDQNFKKSEGMIGIEATENYMKIKDDKLSKLVMVKIKDGKLWCSYDKSDICKHIEYAILKNIGFMLNLIKHGIKMPGEELMKKRLEEIVNQSNE